MEEFDYTLMNAILAAIIGIIAIYKDHRAKNPGKYIFEKITTTGLFLIGLLIAVLFVTILGIVANRRNKINEGKEAKMQQENMTNEINRQVESNRRSLFGDLSIALEKQNLKLDTVNHELLYIKNNPPAPVVAEGVPNLDIYENGIKLIKATDSEVQIKVEVSASSTDVANMQIAQYAFVEFMSGFIRSQKFVFDPSNLIAKGNTTGNILHIETKKERIKSIKFYFQGTYTNSTGKIKRTIDDVYEFHIADNRTGGFREPKKSEFLKSVAHLIK